MYSNIVFAILIIAYTVVHRARQKSSQTYSDEFLAYMEGFALGALLIVSISNFLFTH